MIWSPARRSLTTRLVWLEPPPLSAPSPLPSRYIVQPAPRRCMVSAVNCRPFNRTGTGGSAPPPLPTHDAAPSIAASNPHVLPDICILLNVDKGPAPVRPDSSVTALADCFA